MSTVQKYKRSTRERERERKRERMSEATRRYTVTIDRATTSAPVQFIARRRGASRMLHTRGSSLDRSQRGSFHDARSFRQHFTLAGLNRPNFRPVSRWESQIVMEHMSAREIDGRALSSARHRANLPHRQAHEASRHEASRAIEDTLTAN